MSAFFRLKERLGNLPLFWKVYWVVVALLVFVVTLTEGVLEPVVEQIFENDSGGFGAGYEAALWAATILIPSLACGFILSKVLSTKLGKMVKASRALARGNLEARLPVTGNDKDDFDVLARSFNEMAEAIETQLHNERRLLADISHELRSPLTRMTIATELLSRKQNEAERAAIILRLEKEAAQMGEMVSQLLAQARDKLDSSAFAGPVDISAMLSLLADDFSFQGEAHAIALQQDVEKGLLVYGKTLLLERMFGNLLSNALFYAPEGSKVDLQARREGQAVVVAVRDFGPGVPEAELEDIFRAFYRVDSSRARTSGGAGLGLALAKEAVIYHGGSIRADNVSPGLCITVTLPVYANGRE